MRRKISILMILILSISNIVCSKKKVTYEELSDRLFQDGLVNKRWFKEWKASEKEIKEVKEIIKKIQITIASNDIKGFIGFLGDKVEIRNTLRDIYYEKKKDLLKNLKTMAWIKRWYFGEGKDVKQSYRDYLVKVLNNEEIDAKYKMYILPKTDVITTKKELWLYNIKTEKTIEKYKFGFADPVQPPNNWYKKDITIGINNFGDGWKIYSLLVEP